VSRSLHTPPDALEDSPRKRLSGSRQAGLRVRVYSDWNRLPAAYLELFDEAGRRDFFLTRAWFENFTRTAVDPDCALRIYGIERNDESGSVAGAFVACSRRSTKTTGSQRTISSLTNYYSCFFATHLAAGEDARETLRALARAFMAESPGWETIEIHPLDVDDESFRILMEELRAAGFVVQSFFCFGNWRLAVNGRSFAEYAESLPSVLRNTLQRKRKKLEKTGRARIEILTGGEGLDAAIEAYTTIYLASWKKPEPYPEFIPALIRLCAQEGILRLGVAYVDGQPAAAQLWIVYNGVALIYKLAYDEQFADLSVGTILTANLMQHVLDIDQVAEVDYLSGDDAYKKDWMSYRRERWGILALNPRTLKGALAIARHVGGRFLKRTAMWVAARRRPPKSAGAVQSV
jgi:Acetyltransferase (GNAT) domain